MLLCRHHRLRAESTWPIRDVSRRPWAGRGVLDLVYVSLPLNGLLGHHLVFCSMLLVTLQEDCLAPTTSLEVTKKFSFFPEKSLIELYITVFMTGTLSLYLSQSVVAIPPTLLMPLTCHSGASLKPQSMLTGLPGWANKVTGCKLQESVLLAHPVHCGLSCKWQLWHLILIPSSYLEGQAV